MSIALISMAMSGFSLEETKSKKIVTSTFEVRGRCGMCETKIEEGVMLLNGVKLAVWDKNNQTITVVYNKKKITETKIHEEIAALGYDTGQVKAEQSVYDALPGCCKYREGQTIH